MKVIAFLLSTELCCDFELLALFLVSLIFLNSPSFFSGRFFTVKLPVALDPGAKISVIVEAVYTHVLQPYPTQITQSEKQFVVFEGNHYFYSPYPTKTQTMRVKLASRNVESYTKLGNPTRSEDLLDYGPFRDIPAYSQVGGIQLRRLLQRLSCRVIPADGLGWCWGW